MTDDEIIQQEIEEMTTVEVKDLDGLIMVSVDNSRLIVWDSDQPKKPTRWQRIKNFFTKRSK